MNRLIDNHTYHVTNEITELYDGSAVIYCGKILSFIFFVDNEKRTGIIRYGDTALNVKFDDLELVLFSTNPNDGTPMLS